MKLIPHPLPWNEIDISFISRSFVKSFLNLGFVSKELVLHNLRKKFPSSLCEQEGKIFAGFVSEYGFLYLIRLFSPERSSDPIVLQLWYEIEDKPDCLSRGADLEMTEFESWFNDNLIAPKDANALKLTPSESF